MGEKIIVGPLRKGLRNDVTAFNIDNESFPVLTNAYQWRSRVKRKRGTSTLGRLTIVLEEVSIGVTSASPWTLNIFSPIGIKGNITNITNAANGAVTTLDPHNLETGDQVIISDVVGMTQVNGQTFTITNTGANSFTLAVNTLAFGVYVSGGIWALSTEANATIEQGSVVITIQAGPDIVFTDQGNGTLTSPTPGNSGTINYLTGVIVLTHTAGAGVASIVSFSYYPNLPVMGLEDLTLEIDDFPGTLGFDTKYAYDISTAEPYPIHNVNFYKIPNTSVNFPNYVPKTTATSFTWNGKDYQQFWTVNYQGALWATNGVTKPFLTTNIGMQFKEITGVTIVAVGPPAQADITIAGNGLEVGDFVFINEVAFDPGPPAVGLSGINFQTGYVITAGDPVFRVEFPNAVLGGVYTSGGIAQYLTNTADPTKDTLRWYDGDPITGKGWVNFSPPLSQGLYSIAEKPAAIYYLVGAKAIVIFKNRLLFFAPVIQTKDAGSQLYLQDTVIYSQNGTAYYTSSFEYQSAAPADPTLANIEFFPVLVPDDQTATAPAYFEDQTGFGGFAQSGIDQSINTVESNEDVLIVGHDRLQSRFVYTGLDVAPFQFYTINSELGSSSTFSAISMDQGVFSRGSRGLIITGQTQTQRIDLEIPDEVFELKLSDNGEERFTAKRDFLNEWIYFTYPKNNTIHKFPTRTLQYNYRDQTYGIFSESYTRYGIFRRRTGYTWATIGTVYPTWAQWNNPWNAGASTLLNPEVIAGNSQGFIVFRDDGTSEVPSLFIQNFSGNIVTSPGHCLNNGDFIIISGVLGTTGQLVNNRIFSVSHAAVDSFQLNPIISAGTYIGGGVITKLYVPFIQTKQFPVAWEMARKTRLGPQQYLFTTTSNQQITLLIFLSQNDSSPYNTGELVPSSNTLNNSLIYSTILYTCPESTNLGLTPANINLQMPTALNQQQIWHRMNTSLIGDTVQLGFTLSDAQMRSLDNAGNSATITGATQANPCVLTCTGEFAANTLISITGVVGMTELNNNALNQIYWNVLSSTPTTVTIECDASAFNAYVSGGIAQPIAPFNQTAEIEMHSFILDVSPSQLLA